MTSIPTDRPPDIPATLVAGPMAPLQLTAEHHLCPGCGPGVAWRILMEVISEAGLESRAIGTAGHGCYTTIASIADVEFMQTLHGRAPAVATGIKRARPDAEVFCIQGDGDMVSEGLHEILHAGARGEDITCILLNNGVFGDTGGQMTGTTVVGQRTKTSLEGRDPAAHGYPIPIADLLVQLPGVTYVARGGVTDAGSIARTKRYVRAAFDLHARVRGLTFVEVLTMCPTGWFMTAPEGPGYLEDTVEEQFPVGVLKAPGE